MYLPAILLLLSSTSTLSAPLQPRDANSITSGIAGISNAITTLNNTINTFNGNALTTLPTVLKIEEQNAELADAVSAATTAARNSAALDDAESGTVATAVVNLVPQIKSLLANIVAHKPRFDHALLGVGSVSPQVESDLQKQKALSDELGQAIIAKLTPTYANVAPLVTDQIAGAFEDAIKAFATPGGLFHLPAVNGLGEFEEKLKKFLHL